jgi:hypothetical protein
MLEHEAQLARLTIEQGKPLAGRMRDRLRGVLLEWFGEEASACTATRSRRTCSIAAWS